MELKQAAILASAHHYCPALAHLRLVSGYQDDMSSTKGRYLAKETSGQPKEKGSHDIIAIKTKAQTNKQQWELAHQESNA